MVPCAANLFRIACVRGLVFVFELALAPAEGGLLEALPMRDRDEVGVCPVGGAAVSPEPLATAEPVKFFPRRPPPMPADEERGGMSGT